VKAVYECGLEDGMAVAESSSLVIELHFPVAGSFLPSDHGYLLFSGICALVSDAHGAEWLGVHTIKGRSSRPGLMKISSSAHLRLRLPTDKIKNAYVLAGKNIDVGGHNLRCGVPQIHLLEASKRLWSRNVMIKVADNPSSVEPISFLRAVNRQLVTMGVSARVELEASETPSTRDKYARRILQVKDTVLAGYGVTLDDLNECKQWAWADDAGWVAVSLCQFRPEIMN
jgi:CRISPR-associated endonuclease/helicase Cas3